jgi:hypothetical protein
MVVIFETVGKKQRVQKFAFQPGGKKARVPKEPPKLRDFGREC